MFLKKAYKPTRTKNPFKKKLTKKGLKLRLKF